MEGSFFDAAYSLVKESDGLERSQGNNHIKIREISQILIKARASLKLFSLEVCVLSIIIEIEKKHPRKSSYHFLPSD